MTTAKTSVEMALKHLYDIQVTKPTSVAFGNGGLLFASSIGSTPKSSVVNMYKLNGGAKPTLVGSVGKGDIQEPAGIMVDGDMLYVSDFKAGKVLKFPLDGKSRYSVFTELKNANGIRLGPDGNIYVTQTYPPEWHPTETDSCGKENVHVFSKNGKEIRKFYSQSAYGLAFTSARNLLVADWQTFCSGIREYTLEGKPVDHWGGFSGLVFGICTDGDNTYTCTFFGGVLKYNAQHEIVARENDFWREGFKGFHLSDVEVGPDGYVYVANAFDNRLQVFTK